MIAAISTTFTVSFDADDITNVSQYGACHFEGNAYIEAVFIFLIPMAVAVMLTITLNVHLAIKSFQVHKQIERETRLTSNNISTFKKQNAVH